MGWKKSEYTYVLYALLCKWGHTIIDIPDIQINEIKAAENQILVHT